MLKDKSGYYSDQTKQHPKNKDRRYTSHYGPSSSTFYSSRPNVGQQYYSSQTNLQEQYYSTKCKKGGCTII